MATVSENDQVKLLVYGPPGHGKTTFLGSAIDDSRLMPMLIADFEGGIRAIKSKVNYVDLAELPKHIASSDVIDVVKIKSWEDFDALYDFLDSSDMYRTIALDSLSEMNYLLLTDIIAKAVKEDRKHDPEIAEQRDYLRALQLMRKLVRFFRDLPINLLMTATSNSDEDATTRRQKSVPSLVGKMVQEVPALIEIVGYLAVVEGDDGTTHRRLMTEPSERWMAKARVENSKLPADGIPNPTLPALFDLLGIPKPQIIKTAVKA